jgi:hypothetical protein
MVLPWCSLGSKRAQGCPLVAAGCGALLKIAEALIQPMTSGSVIKFIESVMRNLVIQSGLMEH